MREKQNAPQVENNLMDSLSQLTTFDGDTLDRLLKEIKNADIPYKKAYSDYQSGGWLTAALYAPDEDCDSAEICDGCAVPCEIMKQLPETKALLNALGLDYFSVRIAATQPDAYLWEHADYLELDESQKLRLHIPLDTNSGARMSFSDKSVHLEKGYLWKLDPKLEHAIENKGNSERIHLILDCNMNDRLQQLLAGEFLNQDNIQKLPFMSEDIEAEYIKAASELLMKQGMDAAEQYLLKSFHSYDLGEASSYDLLVKFYDGLGFDARAKHWAEQGIERVIERKALENTPSNTAHIKGEFYKAAYADRSVPQYRVMQDVLNICTDIPGISSSYVRGSLSRGDADKHSDIDILHIVKPNDFERFIEDMDQAVQEKYNVLLPRWTDNIVKDFGGVGFVYLIEDQGKIYQLDLYVACEGAPALQRLYDLPSKQKIYEQPTSGRLTPIAQEKFVHSKYRVNQADIDKVVSGFQDKEETTVENIDELLILGFMIRKCLDRQDSVLANNEFNMYKRTLIKLARAKYVPELKEYGFYHTAALKDDIGDNGEFYNDLMDMTNTPLTSQNFSTFHMNAMKFLEKAYPDEYAENELRFDRISAHITKATEVSIPNKGRVSSRQPK